MATPRTFFSFALLFSCIIFAYTPFLKAVNDERILNKEGQSQLLNAPTSENTNSSVTNNNQDEEEDNSSLFDNLPKFSPEQKGAVRFGVPAGLALLLQFTPSMITGNEHGHFATKVTQVGLAAVATSSMLPGKLGSNLFKYGIKVPLLLSTLAGVLFCDNYIDAGAAWLPKGVPHLMTKEDDSGVPTLVLKVIKYGTVAIAATKLSPYVHQLVKGVGKKLGYTGSSASVVEDQN